MAPRYFGGRQSGEAIAPLGLGKGGTPDSPHSPLQGIVRGYYDHRPAGTLQDTPLVADGDVHLRRTIGGCGPRPLGCAPLTQGYE